MHFKSVLRQHEISYERKLISFGNFTSFYKHVRNKTKSKTDIPPLLNRDGNLLINAVDKAELLNTYFSTVFVADNGILPNSNYCSSQACVSPSNTSISSIYFSELNVNHHIRKLKCKRTLDFDGVSSFLFKKLVDVMSLPLSFLFKLSVSLGKLPSSWKCATISPIFKKGDISCASNYRPISLTSIACKIMEGIIKDEMLF